MFTTMIWGYLAAASVVGFALMAWDKRQAVLARWRVPEKTLMGVAVAGGSLGVYAGMRILRHKTRHPKFSLGVPAILLAQVALLVYLGVFAGP